MDFVLRNVILENGVKMLTNGNIIKDEEVESSGDVKIRAQGFTYNFNIMKDSFEIFNYLMEIQLE